MAFCWSIETTDNVHHRALSRAGWPMMATNHSALMSIQRRGQYDIMRYAAGAVWTLDS